MGSRITRKPRRHLGPGSFLARDDMRNALYLAYGSNLHPLRLVERVPSARPIRVVSLPGRSVYFHKRSDVDCSAKCNLVEAAESDPAYGVLYEIAAEHKPALDAVEGLWSGYEEVGIRILVEGETLEPFVYLAQPSHIDSSLRPYDWYKAMVLAGARYHGLPKDYVAALSSTPSVPDPDPERAAENEVLLQRMADFC